MLMQRDIIGDVHAERALLMQSLFERPLLLLFIQSYVVQRRKNTWVGVVIHGGINGPGFLTIAFGLL